MNADPVEIPKPVDTEVEQRPSFARALRGMWLLTWKSQFTWRRMAGLGIGLLALPLLIYLTTTSKEAWSASHRLSMGSASSYLNGFWKRATRIGSPVPKEQRIELIRIYNEEFKKTEAEWDAAAAGELTVERQLQDIDESYERAINRAQTLLDDNQYRELTEFQKRQRSHRPSVPQDITWGRTTPFYHCLIDLYFFIILPLNCVRMCGALIRDELEANTLSFLTTRPLSRARLLIVKFLSQSIWLQLWFLAQTAVVFAAAYLRGVPDLVRLLPLFLGTQVLAVMAWSALGVLFGQISKRYMALALVYGALVENGIGRIPTNINTLSLMRHLKAVLAHDSVLQTTFQWPVMSVSWPIAALVCAPVLFLVVAALLFTFLEYHHTAEMQK